MSPLPPPGPASAHQSCCLTALITQDGLGHLGQTQAFHTPTTTSSMQSSPAAGERLHPHPNTHTHTHTHTHRSPPNPANNPRISLDMGRGWGVEVGWDIMTGGERKGGKAPVTSSHLPPAHQPSDSGLIFSQPRHVPPASGRSPLTTRPGCPQNMGHPHCLGT